MSRRAAWLWTAAGVVLVILLAGRWLALAATGHLWAAALGVGEAHADIGRLRVLLVLATFVLGSAWCLGNLYLVYRTIDAIRLPRQVGDLEIAEAMPRHYVRVGCLVLGLILAALLARGSGAWWYDRALAGGTVAGSPTDPLLGRDLAYYLFQLPWERRWHGLATRGVALLLVVTTVLYIAIGALRIEARRLRVTRSARMQLAALCAALALVLFWGYRLEPAEYVSGIHAVPYDAILVDVRLPAAKLLGFLALVTAVGSAAWIWVGRLALVAVPWCVLGLASLLGHYVVPAFAGAMRSAELAASEQLRQVERRYLNLGYALKPRETLLRVDTALTGEGVNADHGLADAAPVWDAFAIRAFMNRTADGEPFTRFPTVHLAAYPSDQQVSVPVYLAVPTFDFAAPRGADRDLSWRDVHVGPYAYPRGVVGVHAGAVSPEGRPLFVPDVARPDSVVPQLVAVAVDDDAIIFGAHNRDFALVPATSPAAPFGVRIGGFWRRLALAWTLQSPQLVLRSAVSADTQVLWYRSIADRLERYAPFAEFGDPYPIVADRRVYWVAPGYVTAESFPLVAHVAWRSKGVRYLRAGFVGVVDALTGETSVYLTSNPDPVSARWAALLPTLVRPSSSMPRFVRDHGRYPEELFEQQARLIQAPASSGGRDRVAPRQPAGPEPFAWVGGDPTDPQPQLRIRAAIEHRDPPTLAAIVDGTMRDGMPELTVFRLPDSAEVSGADELVSRFDAARVTEWGVSGALRPIPTATGVLFVQAVYQERREENAAPALVDVIVGWGSTVERGSTLAAALRRAKAFAPRRATIPFDRQRARRLFERMDAARIAGDWAAFGQAYEALRRTLTATGDSLP